jgi:hypothetical protein
MKWVTTGALSSAMSVSSEGQAAEFNEAFGKALGGSFHPEQLW